MTGDFPWPLVHAGGGEFLIHDLLADRFAGASGENLCLGDGIKTIWIDSSRLARMGALLPHSLGWRHNLAGVLLPGQVRRKRRGGPMDRSDGSFQVSFRRFVHVIALVCDAMSLYDALL